MAASRTARAGTKRAVVRRRAVGTRDRIIAHLSAVSEIADSTGMASARLAEAVAYPGSSVAFAQLLSGMERDGLIAREVRGKRTYRITLAGGAPTARLAAARAFGGDAGSAAVGAQAVGAQAVGAQAVGTEAVGAEAVGAEAVTAGAIAAASADAGAMAASADGLDYDELARRLLVQLIRRLAATPSDLERTVAGLEKELATAWSRHGTLSAENVRLREQLLRTQHDLDLAQQRNRSMAITDELDSSEVVVLNRLLAPDQEGDVGQPPATTSERA